MGSGLAASRRLGMTSVEFTGRLSLTGISRSSKVDTTTGNIDRTKALARRTEIYYIIEVRALRGSKTQESLGLRARVLLFRL
jgi:hypothetical protein